ncbi:pyridoxamine 5'-phosphate oxidase family protein [uncultured Croceitalea sp.]|uniref:pyridoxamine 5'-phosphate oxidase family protein n=1 Tax=uncultured Croceitalea sp. TaxID=1798908 RepID=UPI003305B370
MEKLVFEQLKSELVNGSVKKGHPFRYFSLATVNTNAQPQLRTVVLRKVDVDLNLLFYTDRRSQKIEQLLGNDQVAALFYNPKKLLQLQIKGQAFLLKDEQTLKSLWSGIPSNSRKDYTTEHAPGTLIKNPDQIDYLNDENHFCAIKIIPNEIEYLRLKRPNHLRVLFQKKNQDWQSDFLVP